MPHRGQPLVPILPAVACFRIRRGEGLREVIGELIQKSFQTVVVEVAREVIRVKSGGLAHPGDDFLAQSLEIAIPELQLREFLLVPVQPVGPTQHSR